MPNDSPNRSLEFLKQISKLSEATYSEELIQQVKRCLFDYLGATLAGTKMLEQEIQHLLADETMSSGVAPVGFENLINLEKAIFINGLCSHVAELDDGTRFGAVHPGAVLFSALLPVAQHYQVKNADLLRGVVVGYEAIVRIADAIHPDHYKRGYHPTSTCGSIGVALGIATMLNYNSQQQMTVFSAALTSSSGSLKVLENSSNIKPYNVGRSAVDGYLAAMMGKMSFVGPNDPMGGDTGFLSLMTDRYDPKRLQVSEDEKHLGINQVYFKPYAACRHAHAAIEAAIQIRKSPGFDIHAIDEITLSIYETVIGKHDHKEVFGVTSAKMSVPFSIATALIHGKAGIEEFSTSSIEKAEVLQLCGRVRVEVSEDFSKRFPAERPATLKIKMGAEVFEKTVVHPKGEPETRLTDSEVIDKYYQLGNFAGKPKKYLQDLENKVWGLDKQELLFA